MPDLQRCCRSGGALLAVAVLLLGISGCAHTVSKMETTSEKTNTSDSKEVSAQQEEQSSPLDKPSPATPVSCRCDVPASTSYNRLSFTIDPSPEESRLYAQFIAIAQKSGSIAPAFDFRLLVAARCLSQHTAMHQQTPSDRMVQFALQRAGVGEIGVRYLHYGMPSESEQADSEFGEYLANWFAQLQPSNSQRMAALGIYRLHGDDDHKPVDYVTVLLLERELDLETIPKIVPMENRFLVKGSCLQPNCRLGFYLDFMGDHIFQTPIETKQGKFLFEVQVPSAPAVYNLEIVSESERGSRVLLSFPLYHKVPIPQEFKELRKPVECETPEQCERLLLNGINDARARASVLMLQDFDKMQRVARVHAEDMLEHHYSSIYDRQGRPVEYRLQQVGLDILQAGALVDGAYSIRTVLDHFEQSPSLKAFFTNPALTHLGCGVAWRENEFGTRYYSVSCNVATVVDARQGEALSTAIFDYLNGMRHKQGKPLFKREPRLQQVADQALERLLKKSEENKDIQEDVNIQVEQSQLVHKRSIFGVFTIYSLFQLEANSSANQIVQSDARVLVLAVHKITDPTAYHRGIFIYYIAFD